MESIVFLWAMLLFCSTPVSEGPRLRYYLWTLPFAPCSKVSQRNKVKVFIFIFKFFLRRLIQGLLWTLVPSCLSLPSVRVTDNFHDLSILLMEAIVVVLESFWIGRKKGNHIYMNLN